MWSVSGGCVRLLCAELALALGGALPLVVNESRSHKTTACVRCHGEAITEEQGPICTGRRLYYLITQSIIFKAMASNSSLGAALGGEGTADKLPGRSLPSLVLGRLGYPTGGGAPRLVSAEWRGETERLYGRELEIQVSLRDPHNELLTHFLNSAVKAGNIEAARRLIGAGASPNVEVCRFNEGSLRRLIEEPSLMIATHTRSSLAFLVGDPSIHA